jgi:apolipoprotein N-acyltransferase
MRPIDDCQGWMRSSTARRLNTVGACLLSGALLAAAQSSRSLWWLTIFGLVPACLALDASRFLKLWGMMTLLYGLYTALTTYWICNYDATYWFVYLVILAYTTGFTLILAVCCRAACSSLSGGWLLILPWAWGLTELLERHVLLGISWALLGQPLAVQPLLAQGAAIGGPELLSVLVVAFSVALALLVRRCSPRVRFIGLSQGLGLAILAVVWGLIHQGAAAEVGPTIRVGLIQPDVPLDKQWDWDYRETMLSDFDRLIFEAMKEDPDLVVLPETALTGFVRHDRGLADWIKGTVSRIGRPLVFGCLDQDDHGDRIYNAAIMVTNYGTVFEHRKNRLLPLCESIPGWGPLKWAFIRLRGGAVAFTPGDDRTIFSLGNGAAFATLICFEDTFPDLARDYASTGAQGLLSLSNTVTFRGTNQAQQHLRRAQLTAIAVGLPMLRCGNSGISCVIDQYGTLVSVVEEAPRFVGARVLPLEFAQVNTFYRRFGDAAAFTCYGLVITAGIAGTRLAGRWRKAESEERTERPHANPQVGPERAKVS